MNFEEVYKNNRDMINNYMYKAYGLYKIADFMEYEDYKQEILLYLFQLLPKYDEKKASISTYFYRAIMLKANNLRNLAFCNPNKANYGALSLDSANANEKDNLKETVSYKDSIEDTELSIEETIEGEDFLNYVLNAYPSDECYKKVLEYRLLGYSRLKTGKLIGYSRTVVDNRLRLAKKKALEYLKGVEYGA